VDGRTSPSSSPAPSFLEDYGSWHGGDGGEEWLSVQVQTAWKGEPTAEEDEGVEEVERLCVSTRF